MTEEAFKDKRKNAKRKFSLALRKLDGSLVTGLDVVSMKPQASSLEQAYEDLLCVHLEYMDAYPKPDDTYMNEIDEKFNSTLKKYNHSCKTYNDIEMQKQATPLLRTVSLGFKKLDESLNCMETELDKDILDVDSIIVSKQYIESDMNAVIKKYVRVRHAC